MTTHEKVMAVLELACRLEKMRGRDPQQVYKQGNCGNLFYILQSVFPEAVPYAVTGNYGDVDHIVTKIGENFYDITGKLSPLDLKGRLSIASKQALEQSANRYPLFCGWNKDAEDKEKRNAENTRRDLLKIKTFCKHNFAEISYSPAQSARRFASEL